jgi:addiction module RelB/DinJ family antitoxin
MTTVINIKTKKEIKESAQKTASELGLSLSAVINGYLRQFVRNKAVYFSIAPAMTPGLENLLGKIEHDIQRGKNLSQPVSSKKELKHYLASL